MDLKLDLILLDINIVGCFCTVKLSCYVTFMIKISAKKPYHTHFHYMVHNTMPCYFIKIKHSPALFFKITAMFWGSKVLLAGWYDIWHTNQVKIDYFGIANGYLIGESTKSSSCSSRSMPCYFIKIKHSPALFFKITAMFWGSKVLLAGWYDIWHTNQVKIDYFGIANGYLIGESTKSSSGSSGSNSLV